MTVFQRSLLAAVSCTALVAGLAAGAAPASAQSFQGTPTVIHGAATVQASGATTTVTVNTSAVIDWLPTDTAIAPQSPINFQTAGTTATFTNLTAGQNFAVLNRIVPTDTTRPIVFNGSVVSQLQGTLGTAPGGTVFFYSPGGIVLSNTAAFNVGSLGLTTAAPQIDLNGDWLVNNQVQLAGANSQSSVVIQPLATVAAPSPNSYVAVFAPRIEQAGTITVNGQAALVSGEAGTLTFSPDGMFDIQVSLGADAQYGGLVNSGTITGPASSGPGDNHRIYMVTGSRNGLTTLALTSGSKLGFDIAGSAQVVGNAVVLTAGYDIADGLVSTPNSATGKLLIRETPGQNTDGIIFTSGLSGFARGDVQVDSYDLMRFHGDVHLAGLRSLLFVGNTAPGGDGLFEALGDFRFGGLPEATERTIADIYLANGIRATFAGNLSLESVSTADLDLNQILLGDISVMQVVSGADVTVGGNLLLDARTISNGSAQAVGGPTRLRVADAGSTLAVTGAIRLDSSAEALLGGIAAAGGEAVLDVVSGGSLTTRSVEVASNARGGSVSGAGLGNGGSADPGTAWFVVSGASSSAVLSDQGATRKLLSSVATGGNTSAADAIGGAAADGRINFFVSTGGLLTINGPARLNVDVSAYGGNASGARGTGGNAASGTLAFSVDTAGAVLQGGSLNFDALAIGGSATGGTPGSGGSATSSTLAAQAAQVAQLSVQDFTFTSLAQGGSGGSGGAATGGGLSITALDGTLSVAGSLQATMRALGGNATGPGTGGNATAGAILFDAINSSQASQINLNNATLNLEAIGGNGGSAPAGTGGIGGNANGGSAQVFSSAINGRLMVGGAFAFNALVAGGAGGSGQTGGAGGTGQGPSLLLGTKSGGPVVTSAGMSTFNTVAVAFVVDGGDGGTGTQGTGGAGGAANGGQLTLQSRGAPVNANNISMTGVAHGGDGGSGATLAGFGGNGAAPFTSIVASNAFQSAQRGSSSFGNVTFSGTGIGGTGSTPGLGIWSNSDLSFTLTDVVLGNLTWANTGTSAPSSGQASITLDNATVALGNLDFNFSGTVGLALEASTLTASRFEVQAATIAAIPATSPGTITAGQSIELVANGAIELLSSLSSPSISLSSSALILSGNAVLNAGAAGTVALETGNTLGMTIGQVGMPTGAYAVTDQLLTKITAGSLNLTALANVANDVDVLIGALAGSTLPFGTVRVAVENGSGTRAGAIRIIGNVPGSTSDLTFLSDRFELDNTTASLTADTLTIAASDIIAASTTVLNDLANNPALANLVDLILTAPAGTSGQAVIDANSVSIEVANNLLIQNTGRADVPAGLTVGTGSLQITAPANATPLVVISVQVDTGTGLLTGAVAASALLAGLDRQVTYDPRSRVGTCFIDTGNCGTSVVVGDVIVPVDEVVAATSAAVSAQVQPASQSGTTGGSVANPVVAAPAPTPQGVAAPTPLALSNAADVAAETGGSGSASAVFESSDAGGTSTSGDGGSSGDGPQESAAAEGEDSPAEAGKEEAAASEEETEAEEAESEEEEEEDAEERSPIPAPPLLINTDALAPPVIVTEPFTSGGNPALQDAAPSPPTQETD